MSSDNSINTTNVIPSNEEIIDDLTEDFKSQCIETPEKECDSHKTTGSGSGGDGIELSESDSNLPEEFNENASEKECIEEDYVDEEILKDLEGTLTEEDKVLKRTEASALKQRGNEQHKSGKCLEAVSIYTEALRLCPLCFSGDRAILYANRAASKISVGRQKSAIDDCTKAIELNPEYIRAYLRRAKLYEETEKFDESLEDYKKILEMDPSVADARSGCTRLPPLIAERNERLKTEMLGKLKDLGNMILKPFGLSTENFKLNQDPNSGGYSVNFSQNVNK